MEVTLPDGTLIKYLHDPLGRRIAKLVNGTVTEKYLWSGPTTLLAVYDGNDNLKIRFEYTDERMPPAMTKNGTRYYLAYDQVGTLKRVIDPSGNVVKELTHDTFGNIITDSNPGFATPFGFAGGLRDPDTNLVRFGARDYAPEIGRWTAKDPILFAGGDTNLYGYCLNDPINAFDPEGLDLVLVGQGGDSGSMFKLAAETWVNENPGSHKIVPVNSGKEFISAINSYAKSNNGVDGLRYFGHSGNSGLYVDQSSGYASLYSSGAGWWYSFIESNASRIGQIDPSLFNKGATVGLYGCNTANGKNSLAEKLANHLGIPVTGSQSGNSFSGVPNGKVGEGLPNPVPWNYTPVYLVPEGKGWKTFPGK